MKSLYTIAALLAFSCFPYYYKPVGIEITFEPGGYKPSKPSVSILDSIAHHTKNLDSVEIRYITLGTDKYLDSCIKLMEEAREGLAKEFSETGRFLKNYRVEDEFITIIDRSIDQNKTLERKVWIEIKKKPKVKDKK